MGGDQWGMGFIGGGDRRTGFGCKSVFLSNFLVTLPLWKLQVVHDVAQ